MRSGEHHEPAGHARLSRTDRSEWTSGRPFSSFSVDVTERTLRTRDVR